LHGYEHEATPASFHQPLLGEESLCAEKMQKSSSFVKMTRFTADPFINAHADSAVSDWLSGYPAHLVD
tara:strand:+ start:13520 stop:13723 length:204 start_codon:yes stop_codon:yes gene_type:complete